MAKGLPRSLAHANKALAPIVKETITVINKPVTLTEDVGGQPAWATLVVGDFPEGNVLFLGAVAYFTFSGSGADADLGDTWAGDYGIGTAPSTDDTDPIAGTQQDLIADVAIAAATAEVSPRTRAASVAAAQAALFDNTDGSLEINLNLLVDAADITGDDSIITINGDLFISYIVLGDD